MKAGKPGQACRHRECPTGDKLISKHLPTAVDLQLW
jgi:hypothetical protein